MTRLLVLGDLNLDVHAEDAPTDRGQETRATVRATPGGSAGTFARIAAKLGAHVEFLGAVGRDVVGDLLERDLIASGVQPHLQRADMASGAVLALFRDGDRSMVCARGANDALDEEAVVASLFVGLDHLHISGYAFLSSSQARAARRAIALARRATATVSLNAPPASLIAAFGVKDFLREAREADMLILNWGEGQLLTDLKEPETIIDALATSHAAGSLTLGAEGAVAWRGSERSRARPPATLDVDPTGAGDAYAAAFVVRLLSGDGLDTANHVACATAHAHLAARVPCRSSS